MLCPVLQTTLNTFTQEREQEPPRWVKRRGFAVDHKALTGNCRSPSRQPQLRQLIATLFCWQIKMEILCLIFLFKGEWHNLCYDLYNPSNALYIHVSWLFMRQFAICFICFTVLFLKYLKFLRMRPRLFLYLFLFFFLLLLLLLLLNICAHNVQLFKVKIWF